MVLRAVALVGRGDGAIDLDAAGGARELVVGAAEFDLDAVNDGAYARFAHRRLQGVAGLVDGHNSHRHGEAVGELNRPLLPHLQIGDGEGENRGEKEK